MAIFEKPSQTKVVVDDTENLICLVENAQNINKHTEYILRVQRGANKDSKWYVSRRYRDFAALHASLQQAGIDLPLPPKKLIGNMQPSFIAERQIGLQNYINEVLKHPILAMSLQVRSFLDPTHYSLTIAEQALQTVSIALRGDGRYELKGPLDDIGWRLRKHYFQVTDVESKSNCLLSWQSYGPDRTLSDKDMQTAFKSLQNLTHPYIDPILAIHNLETGAYVVRKIHENGSLRDILYGTDYYRNHLTKYGNPKVRKPFTMGQIAQYGYQILQALKFLHDKGIPHGHIHSGNIAIENKTALLMDVENSLVGSSCVHRSRMLNLRRAVSAEAADVYCFGLLLYEMAFAKLPDHTHSWEQWGSGDLELAIQMCLQLNYGGPNIDELLLSPPFARAPPAAIAPVSSSSAPDARAHLKFPLALKDELRAAYARSDARMKADHKMVRAAKREVRIQEILNSEEEMRKQKRRAKKRESVWKSSSSLADTTRSRSASTGSEPTPPGIAAETNGNGSMTPAAATPPDSGRSALLDAICAFDKARLARVAAR